MTLFKTTNISDIVINAILDTADLSESQCLRRVFDKTLELLTVLQDEALVVLKDLSNDVAGLKLICPILTINAVFSINALFIF